MKNDNLHRICFLLRVKTTHLEEYKRWHKNVWPELLQGFRETGWHNFSLFLREDGLLVGYVETPDFDRALAEMNLKEVNHRWQSQMRDFFEDPQGRPADRQIVPIEEVFHLD
jgi:L-rhamnose mutarotase